MHGLAFSDGSPFRPVHPSIHSPNRRPDLLLLAKSRCKFATSLHLFFVEDRIALLQVMSGPLLCIPSLRLMIEAMGAAILSRKTQKILRRIWHFVPRFMRVSYSLRGWKTPLRSRDLVAAGSKTTVRAIHQEMYPFSRE